MLSDCIRLAGSRISGWTTVAPPEPRTGQVLVQVHAAAITRDELEWPTDRLPAIPSYELSGILTEDADGLSAGAEVFALRPSIAMALPPSTPSCRWRSSRPSRVPRATSRQRRCRWLG